MRAHDTPTPIAQDSETIPPRTPSHPYPYRILGFPPSSESIPC
jgi:hypothetical protein